MLYFTFDMWTSQNTCHRLKNKDFGIYNTMLLKIGLITLINFSINVGDDLFDDEVDEAQCQFRVR